jgi:hypothetical protein
MSISGVFPELRKWLAIGTGVGIEIGARDLHITVARVRPSGAEVIGAAFLESFRETPAAEWGSEYSELLRRLGSSHLSAAVLLPRRDVIVRQLPMAGVSKKDLPAAIEFQIDSLHPFGDNEAVYSWTRLGQTGPVLIGIARREAIERYAALFDEAGVKVSLFLFSAAACYSALRLFSAGPKSGFVSASETGEGIEVYGESPARPLFSALFDSDIDKAVGLAASELRIDGAENTPALHEVLPKPAAVPDGYDLSRNALAYAAALAGACPRLALPVNLLPPERRHASSRGMYIPTAVLAFALILVVIGLASITPIEDRRYLNALQSEIARLEPLAKRAAVLDRAIEKTRVRSRLLDEFRKRTTTDLDAIHELTRILPGTSFLTALELTRTQMTASGEAEQAAPLLKTIDASPAFENSEFMMPIGRAGTAEAFGIRAHREGAPK